MTFQRRIIPPGSSGDEAGFFEVGFQLLEEGGVGNFLAVGAGEAEGVDGGAAEALSGAVAPAENKGSGANTVQKSLDSAGKAGYDSDMSVLLEKIRSEARRLPVEEQQALALDLLDTAQGDYEPAEQVAAAWDVEISRRAEQIRQGVVVPVPWSQVQANLAKEYGWNG